MTVSGTAVFTNPDDYRAGIDDVSIELVLAGPGDFKARLTWLKFISTHFVATKTSRVSATHRCRPLVYLFRFR
jgi:hypothetical protein